MKKIKFIMLCIIATLIACDTDEGGSDDGDLIAVDFSITHDTFSNIESPFTTIRILDSDGDVLDEQLNVGGDNPVYNISLFLPSSDNSVDVSLFSSREGGKTVFVNDIDDGATVTWNTVDDFASVSGSGSNPDGNPLLGRWDQIPVVCTNANGDGNFFNFSSATSGIVFQSDCNNICMNGGVITEFNYQISGNSLTITPTDVSSCAGEEVEVPPAFTSTWSISGSILTLDGQEFERN